MFRSGHWRSWTGSAAAIHLPRASSMVFSRPKTPTGPFTAARRMAHSPRQTPGDTSMATLSEVEAVMKCGPTCNG
jgi:hypothetical protein